ncbi:MAG: alpha/beta hydrolase [Verrucomicrobia bacterium]|nr:alpha/beta hydrolase [Verrucomicrobiota bacterium]
MNSPFFSACRVAIVAVMLLGVVVEAAPEGKRLRSKGGGGFGYPPELPGAKAEVYKTVGDVKLSLYIFTPPDHKPDDKRPAIVFFFGGGWTSGSPGQFLNQCRYLASRGMVAITADYRVASRHQVKAVECVKDTKSAIRWVRANAKRLGIDPGRIAAGGGSAGGHLAACTGTVTEFDEKGEDAAVSSVPNAMVLFNPALVLAPLGGLSDERLRALLNSDRCGVEPVKISPCHHVRAGAPPAIIFHGKADTTVPYATAEAFAEAMKKVGSRCELAGFEDQPHGFFNFGRNENKFFVETVRKMDQFLASLGWLKGEPTIEEFAKTLK